MASAPITTLTARKVPRQARATVTVDAVFEAAIQLLDGNSPVTMSTTQIARRAGVSVGTIYQYFPNKQALFFALSASVLDGMASNVELVCRQHHGESLRVMTRGLVDGYWRAVTGQCANARAVHKISIAVDTAPLIEAFSLRIEDAAAKMFASAPNVSFPDLRMTTITLLTSLIGSIRTIFERLLPKPWACDFQEQIALMCEGYITATASHDLSKSS
ncbi:TetR family transcriptional regulator [Acetobacter nitrogenifigens DSM 23921 = NBRC 105050]|uniref:TetR family transcriptional regulator n=1 Tax=Acetobacter nitrogenifigens DSM 23921 = NBRC 105050 TaxID=1120919 RepID=A0A511XF51_9PROT|nr:TetR/AcrR family transcriptional regulator [Acetobacter nitrogenifigens]GBQ97036.1 TetR family transcriptional regulator [Acetobacter nitrogenifigens DSM 23921 = NBRC 105050]GEN61580.1 TetR family transcriptional regulator [Acetobacter nitrogenifigens DSM 23921 = NBRC 105050]